jgi:hypothetical protein
LSINVSREDGEKGKKKVTMLGRNLSSGTYGRVDKDEIKFP